MKAGNRSKEGIKAASCTYKINAKAIEEKLLKMKTFKTPFPKKDFHRILDHAASYCESHAYEWYRNGLIMGFKKAINMIIAGKLTQNKKGEISLSRAFPINFSLKVDGKPRKEKFTIQPEDVGFCLE